MICNLNDIKCYTNVTNIQKGAKLKTKKDGCLTSLPIIATDHIEFMQETNKRKEKKIRTGKLK